MARVRTGLERLLDRPEPVRGLRVGLVVNPSSITADLEHASVALSARRGVKLAGALPARSTVPLTVFPSSVPLKW